MRDRDENGNEPDAATLELDDADHKLVDKLRGLPPDGDEPDWKRLEAAIRAEVSPLSTPAPWWRNWRWLVPIGALATTAAIVMTIEIRNGGDGQKASANRMTMRDASIDESDPTDKTGTSDKVGKTGALDDTGDARDIDDERAAAMWLDGEAAELDELAPDALDAFDDLERDMLAELRAARAPGDVTAAFDEPGRDDDPLDEKKQNGKAGG